MQAVKTIGLEIAKSLSGNGLVHRTCPLSGGVKRTVQISGPSWLFLAFTADHGTCIWIDEMEALARNAFHRFTRGL